MLGLTVRQGNTCDHVCGDIRQIHVRAIVRRGGGFRPVEFAYDNRMGRFDAVSRARLRDFIR
jgi:hypothetical protein